MRSQGPNGFNRMRSSSPDLNQELFNSPACFLRVWFSLSSAAVAKVSVSAVRLRVMGARRMPQGV